MYYTKYRQSSDRFSRGWITVDKKEIADMSDLRFLKLRTETDRAIKAGTIIFDGVYVANTHGYTAPEAMSLIQREGTYPGWTFPKTLGDSLSLSTDDMLRSENGIVRGLAMLDGRLGKRRLRALALPDDELPLVRTLHTLRCEAERVAPRDAATAAPF